MMDIDTWVKNNLVLPLEEQAPTSQELLGLADAILDAD